MDDSFPFAQICKTKTISGSSKKKSAPAGKQVVL